MNKPKTLYISDLDNTLLNSDSELSDYTKNTLNELVSKGIDFTVATGRTTDAAQQIMSDVELIIPIVSFNGVVIYSAKEKRCEKVFWLSTKTVIKIVNVLKSHDVPFLMYEYKDNELIAYYETLEHEPISDFIRDRKARYNSAFSQVSSFDDVSAEHIMYFTLKDTYDRIKPVYDVMKEIANINIALVDDTSIDGLWWLEIFSADASKENAVKFLRAEYGYNKVVGFGDNYNDLPMFKACDICVAVKNALSEVIAAADYICDTNDNDGVAKWLKEKSI